MAPDIGDVLNVFVYQSTNARNVTVLALHLRRRHVVPLDPGLNRARQIVSVRKNGIDMFDQMARLQLPRVLFNRLESSARRFVRRECESDGSCLESCWYSEALPSNR